MSVLTLHLDIPPNESTITFKVIMQACRLDHNFPPGPIHWHYLAITNIKITF